jgi:hypothetical protein
MRVLHKFSGVFDNSLSLFVPVSLKSMTWLQTGYSAVRRGVGRSNWHAMFVF